MIRKITLLLLLSLFSCNNEPEDLTAIIEKKAAERLVGFRNNFANSCRENVLKVARARADSLLLLRARKLKNLAGRPPKPSRPGAPPVLELTKELPLRPLFPFEIRFDTLLRDSLYQDSLRIDSLLRFDFSIDSIQG